MTSCKKCKYKHINIDYYDPSYTEKHYICSRCGFNYNDSPLVYILPEYNHASGVIIHVSKDYSIFTDYVVPNEEIEGFEGYLTYYTINECDMWYLMRLNNKSFKLLIHDDFNIENYIDNISPMSIMRKDMIDSILK
jgi:hypothetical protein